MGRTTSAGEPRAGQGGFPALLKRWRGRRRLSQLGLALEADVSARHIAFLEMGRARPSRAMVLRLATTLDIPRQDRNDALVAAGFAPIYGRRPLDAAEMAPVRAALDWTLGRHDPYPAMALDRGWTIVAANRSAARLLAAAGARAGENLLEALLADGGIRAHIENWPEVARHLAARLRLESAHLGGEPALSEAAARLAATADAAEAAEARELAPVVPTRYRVGDRLVSLFSVLAQFGTAEDIALADLRLELMYPADDASRSLLEALAVED